MIFDLDFIKKCLGYPEEEPSECDTRYGFCALATLKLINKLDVINQQTAGEYLLRCQNFDGGFGVREGSESHAGQVFCATGSLKILDRLKDIDTNLLGWWLAERQVCLQAFFQFPYYSLARMWWFEWTTNEERRCVLFMVGAFSSKHYRQIKLD